MIKEEELGSNSYSFATTVHSSAPWRGPLFFSVHTSRLRCTVYRKFDDLLA